MPPCLPPPAASRRDPVAIRRLWVDRLERFCRTNQTAAQFCAAEGISEPSFYVWKRALAGEAKATAPVAPAIVPIRLTPSPSCPQIELVLPSGTALRFPVETRPEVIAAVVHAVAGRPW